MANTSRHSWCALVR